MNFFLYLYSESFLFDLMITASSISKYQNKTSDQSKKKDSIKRNVLQSVHLWPPYLFRSSFVPITTPVCLSKVLMKVNFIGLHQVQSQCSICQKILAFIFILFQQDPAPTDNAKNTSNESVLLVWPLTYMLEEPVKHSKQTSYWCFWHCQQVPNPAGKKMKFLLCWLWTS